MLTITSLAVRTLTFRHGRRSTHTRQRPGSNKCQSIRGSISTQTGPSDKSSKRSGSPASSVGGTIWGNFTEMGAMFERDLR